MCAYVCPCVWSVISMWLLDLQRHNNPPTPHFLLCQPCLLPLLSFTSTKVFFFFFYIHSFSPPHTGGAQCKAETPPLSPLLTHPQSSRELNYLSLWDRIWDWGGGQAEPLKAQATEGVCSEGVAHACLAARGAREVFVWPVTRVNGAALFCHCFEAGATFIYLSFSAWRSQCMFTLRRTSIQGLTHSYC